MTTKSLISKEDGETYIQISTTLVLRSHGPLPFDIYIQRAEGAFTKLFSKETIVDHDAVKRYRDDKQILFLYVKDAEKRDYHYYVEKLLESGLANPDGKSRTEITHALNEMVNICLDEIHQKCNLDKRSLRWAESSAKMCTKFLLDDFDGLVRILKAIASRPYNIKHSFMVSIFSLLLAKANGYESQKTFLTVGLGGLLHDIGMTRLDSELVEKTDLTNDDWKEIKQHCQIGARILGGLKNIGQDVRLIVLHHHEQPNGHGYPDGLKDREIFYLAKVIAIADVFTALITTPPFKTTAFSPLEAFNIMIQDGGRFDQALLKTFLKVFLKHSGLKNLNNVA